MAIDLMSLSGRVAAEHDGSGSKARASASSPSTPEGARLAEEFQRIFGEKLSELVDVTQETARLDRDFAAGVEGVGIDDVMVSAAKSGLAVDAAVQVRNLAFRAFQTLTQLR